MKEAAMKAPGNGGTQTGARGLNGWPAGKSSAASLVEAAAHLGPDSSTLSHAPSTY